MVEGDVHHVVQSTRFLKSKPSSTACPVARLHRSELVLGQIVGKGGFSEVREILAMKLDSRVDDQLSSHDRSLRRKLADSCLDERGQPRWVIKHLQERLLEGPSVRSRGSASSVIASDEFSRRVTKFGYAAADLVTEGEYLSRLQHPNVVQLAALPLNGMQAWWEPDGRHDSYFLVLERVDGTWDDALERERHDQQRQSLLSSRSQSPSPLAPLSTPFHGLTNTTPTNTTTTTTFTLDDKLRLSLQLAQALDYLHSQSIIFRDLKPQNIGLTTDPLTGSTRVVLLDFGLCREVPCDHRNNPESAITGTYHMSAVGTRRYMAVEVVNHSRYNLKADVYSWSMVVWELLTGQRPFAAYSIHEHGLHVCLQGERPPLRGLPQDVQNLLACCWTEDVTTRLTVREVTVLLASIVRGRDHDLEISTSVSGEAVPAQSGSLDNEYHNRNDCDEYRETNYHDDEEESNDRAMAVSSSNTSRFLYELHAQPAQAPKEQPQQQQLQQYQLVNCGAKVLTGALRTCLSTASTQSMSDDGDDDQYHHHDDNHRGFLILPRDGGANTPSLVLPHDHTLHLSPRPDDDCCSIMTLSLSSALADSDGDDDEEEDASIAAAAAAAPVTPLSESKDFYTFQGDTEKDSVNPFSSVAAGWPTLRPDETPLGPSLHPTFRPSHRSFTV